MAAFSHGLANGSDRLELVSGALRRGAAAVEAALVLPILVALTFGVIEYGYLFFVQHNVKAAAQVGARAGIVPTATAVDVEQAVRDYLVTAGLAGALPSEGGIAVEYPAPQIVADRPVQHIRVTVKCRAGVIGSVRILSATVVMQRE